MIQENEVKLVTDVIRALGSQMDMADILSGAKEWIEFNYPGRPFKLTLEFADGNMLRITGYGK